MAAVAGGSLALSVATAAPPPAVDSPILAGATVEPFGWSPAGIEGRVC